MDIDQPRSFHEASNSIHAGIRHLGDDQYMAAAQPFRIDVRLFVRDAQIHQRADDATCHRAHACASECGKQRPGGNDRPHARNGERAEANEQAA